MITLSNQSLLKTKAYINGEWVGSEVSFNVLNPYNQQVLAAVSNGDSEITKAAIQAAHHAFKGWSKVTAGERSSILKKWHQLMLTHADDLATILTLEQGKPLAEAKGEILYGASFVEWFAEEARRVYGDTIPGHQADKRIIVLKQPIGVVGAITPWNFPNAMITRKVAPALAAGCTVVIKPAEDTPLSALAIAALADQAGFPPGVINVIPTNQPSEVGSAFLESKLVRKLSFTGSTQTGKFLMSKASGTLKKLSLELGGNAPFIVFKDADINKAVEGAIASKYRNAGQTCVCANRLIVHRDIKAEFVEKLTRATENLRVGNGMTDGVDIGPLINEKGKQKVNDLVEDAVNNGAIIQCGGKPGDGLIYKPTVLTDVSSDMKISQEEIFGPVSCIMTFETEEEAIHMANETDAGLASYFYGNDMGQIWRVAEALEYGMVGINTGMISTTVAPFGGVKESGFGREGSKYGMEDYLNVKYLCLEV